MNTFKVCATPSEIKLQVPSLNPRWNFIQQTQSEASFLY